MRKPPDTLEPTAPWALVVSRLFWSDGRLGQNSSSTNPALRTSLSICAICANICQIKKTHGDRITLWGGVAIEHIIGGTTEQVRQDVRRAMRCAKDGGRFILGTSHSVAVGSNYDNYMAMLDEYHKLCDY